MKNYKIKNQTKKWWLEIFLQGLNRKRRALFSINHLNSPLTENIAVRLHLFLLCLIIITRIIVQSWFFCLLYEEFFDTVAVELIDPVHCE